MACEALSQLCNKSATAVLILCLDGPCCWFDIVQRPLWECRRGDYIARASAELYRSAVARIMGLESIKNSRNTIIQHFEHVRNQPKYTQTSQRLCRLCLLIRLRGGLPGVSRLGSLPGSVTLCATNEDRDERAGPQKPIAQIVYQEEAIVDGCFHRNRNVAGSSP